MCLPSPPLEKPETPVWLAVTFIHCRWKLLYTNTYLKAPHAEYSVTVEYLKIPQKFYLKE